MTYITLPPPSWAIQFILDNKLKLELGIQVSNIYTYFIKDGMLLTMIGDNNNYYSWPWEKVLNNDFTVGV